MVGWIPSFGIVFGYISFLSYGFGHGLVHSGGVRSKALNGVGT